MQTSAPHTSLIDAALLVATLTVVAALNWLTSTDDAEHVSLARRHRSVRRRLRTYRAGSVAMAGALLAVMLLSLPGCGGGGGAVDPAVSGVTDTSETAGGDAARPAALLAPLMVGPTVQQSAAAPVLQSSVSVQIALHVVPPAGAGRVMVDAWLTRTPARGGGAVALPQHQAFSVPVGADTGAVVQSLGFALDTRDQPPPGDWDYALQVRLRAVDAAGAPLHVLGSYTATAQWAITAGGQP